MLGASDGVRALFGADDSPQRIVRRCRRTPLQSQHDKIVGQVFRRDAPQATVDQHFHRTVVGVDPSESERTLAARRMANRLLQPVVLRRAEDAVVGSNLLGQFRIGGEVVGAEDGIRLDGLAEFGDDLVAGAALHHGVDVPTVSVYGGQDRNLLMRQAGLECAGTAIARRTVLRRSASLPTAMTLETPKQKRLVDPRRSRPAAPASAAPEQRADGDASARQCGG